VPEREFALIKERLEPGSRQFLIKQGHTSVVCALDLKGMDLELAVISGRSGTVERVRRLYEFRQRRFKIRAGKIEDEDGLEEGSLAYQRMMHEIYAAQRRALVGLRNSREISSDVMRRVEHELDLEESRLEI
jgi:hypothetical protein